MAPVISIRKIAEDVDMLSDGWTAYLNRQSGEVYSLQDEMRRKCEEDGNFTPGTDWERQEVAKIREIIECDDWLPLPGTYELHEWSIMKDFAHSIADEDLQDLLLSSIHGSGAFRHFKDVLYRHGISDSWFRFKTEAIEHIVARWLDIREIPYGR